MTSQAGQQTITIHTLPIISQSKSNQTVKLDQLIEYNNRNIFFKNHEANETGTSCRTLFFFKKKRFL